jgi:signal transduction histidine kinase
MDLGELIDEFIAECADPHVFVFTKMEGISLRTNRQMLGIVIENLLSNAYKYASDRRVMVQVEKEFADPTDRQASSDLLVLRVINHVSEENMPDETKLFDRYYRHPNVMGISGLGIGLSLVQSAVARMGGSVSSAIQNHQVCFTVRIPDNMRKTV